MKNNPHSAMIRRLDHIAIKTGTPEKLFLFFTEILGLPVIWPVSKEPGFTTGGFFIGNANMETLPVEKHSSGQTAPDSAITVLTFESQPLVDLEEQLRRCGLQPTEPSQTIQDYDGRAVRAWTSLCLESLSSPRHAVCLREYDKDYKGQLAKTISFSTPLGSVGLLGMKEICLKCSNLTQTQELWSRFLGLTADTSHTFKQDGMPNLRLVAAKEDGIESLTLKVKSLEKARQFLTEKHLLGQQGKTSVSIAPRAVQGLHIKFSE